MISTPIIYDFAGFWNRLSGQNSREYDILVTVHRCPVNVTAYAHSKSPAAVLNASGACLEPTETECRGGICFASITVLAHD